MQTQLPCASYLDPLEKTNTTQWNKKKKTLWNILLSILERVSSLKPYQERNTFVPLEGPLSSISLVSLFPMTKVFDFDLCAFPRPQPLLLSTHSLPNEKHPCDAYCCRMEELEDSFSASSTRQHHFKEQRHRFALNRRQIFAVVKKKGFFIVRQTYLPTSSVPTTITQAFHKLEQTQPLLLFPCVSFVSARKRLPRHFLILQVFFSHCYKMAFIMHWW